MKKNISKLSLKLPVDLRGSLPVIEFSGNRSVTVEGSSGVLHYSDSEVRINTRSAVLNFKGRGLRINCISPTCVIVEGFILNLEFIN